MATEAEYEKRIKAYSRKNLLRLWEQIQTNKAQDWEPGKAFEYLVLRAFQLEGAEVRWPYTVKIVTEIIEQVDGLVYADGLACLVECKDQADDKSNIQPVAKLRNLLLRRPSATIGAVFSRSGFTEPVEILARYLAPQTILLWNGLELDLTLRQHLMRRGLVWKYQRCVEEGHALYDLREELLQ